MLDVAAHMAGTRTRYVPKRGAVGSPDPASGGPPTRRRGHPPRRCAVAPRGVTRQVLSPVRAPRRHGGWRRLDTLRVAHVRSGVRTPATLRAAGITVGSPRARHKLASRCAAPQLVAGLVAVIMPYCIRPLVKARCMISRHHASRMTFHHSFGRRMTGHGSHTPTQTE